MQETQTNFLTEDLIQRDAKARKMLLPLWIKIFSWIFLVFGFLVPLVLVLGILGFNAELALYGLETNEVFSVFGLIILILFAIKAVVAFGLLKEKDWAIKAGIGDAFIGILVCAYVMLYAIINSEAVFSFRLELVALIPYLIKLKGIRIQWESLPKI